MSGSSTQPGASSVVAAVHTPTSSSRSWSVHVQGWLLLLPAAVLLVVFTHFPVAATLYHSFFSNPKPGRAAVGVGADNYRAVVEGPGVWPGVWKHVWFAAGAMPATV